MYWNIVNIHTPCSIKSPIWCRKLKGASVMTQFFFFIWPVDDSFIATSWAFLFHWIRYRYEHVEWLWQQLFSFIRAATVAYNYGQAQHLENEPEYFLARDDIDRLNRMNSACGFYRTIGPFKWHYCAALNLLKYCRNWIKRLRTGLLLSSVQLTFRCFGFPQICVYDGPKTWFIKWWASEYNVIWSRPFRTRLEFYSRL